MSCGRAEDGHADWWVSLLRDGEAVVDDHRVRADGDLGEALAAVLTAVKCTSSTSVEYVE